MTIVQMHNETPATEPVREYEYDSEESEKQDREVWKLCEKNTKEQELPEHLRENDSIKHLYPKEGFLIAYNTDKNCHEAQVLDELKEYGIELCKTDDEAVEAAKKMGYEFNDPENPYKVTSKI